MKKYKLHFVVLLIFVFASLSNAREWRVLQIPNGSKFSCANCHVNPGGGGSRNKFGQDVEKLVPAGGTAEFWGFALANLDSDGDGKKNGQELGDPNGTWRPGQVNPGIFNSVTNAGDPSSVTSIENLSVLPSEYKLYDNYPNPFNPSTNIKFDLAEQAFTKLIIYDQLGREVETLISGELMPGTHEVRYEPKGISSGAYFYTLQTNRFSKTKKLLLTK